MFSTGFQTATPKDIKEGKELYNEQGQYVGKCRYATRKNDSYIVFETTQGYTFSNMDMMYTR